MKNNHKFWDKNINPITGFKVYRYRNEQEIREQRKLNNKKRRFEK